MLQDHMRKAGDVCFAEVSRDSEGIKWAACRDNTFMFMWPCFIDYMDIFEELSSVFLAHHIFISSMIQFWKIIIANLCLWIGWNGGCAFLLSAGTYGLVDYTNYEDMKYAVSLLCTRAAGLLNCWPFYLLQTAAKSFWIHQIRKLDDSEFRNPWTRTYIRVYSIFCFNLCFFVSKPISICCSFIFITSDMCLCNLVQVLLLITFKFYDNIGSTEVCIRNICFSALNLI